MKLSGKFLPALVLVSGNSAADVDGDVVHQHGCIWPDANVLAPKFSYADDPYARFVNLDATGINDPYSEGTEIQRQCPTSCEYDGTDYVNCTGYEDDMLITCTSKEGKAGNGAGNNRPAGTNYVFQMAGKKMAVFFRTSRLDKYRPVPPHKLCSKPSIAIGDPESVCGDKPAIPTKDDVVRFDKFTHWTANGLSVACNDNARPIRANNFEQLNLVCDRQKPSSPYKWFHESPNGRLRPAGNKWIKNRYLCRFCHDCDNTETSGDEPEGSGGNSPDNAEVTL